MKIAIASDLHYDPRGHLTRPELVQALIHQIAASGPDLVVLAGDLAHGRHSFEECVRCFTQIDAPIAVLAGNHDIWEDTHERYTSEELWSHVLESVTLRQGGFWLEKQNFIFGEIGIVGSLAWYDYSAVDPSIEADLDFIQSVKSSLNNDGNWINWDRTDRSFAQELSRAMISRLRQLSEDPNIRDIIVITHVPIVEEQIVRKPGNREWGLSNAYFGNLTLGLEVLKAPKVRAIVSGHTHIGKRAVITRRNLASIDVRVVESDYGRPGYTLVSL
jgi:3',5'-cyclic AMP phosphodiesterase CpdA